MTKFSLKIVSLAGAVMLVGAAFPVLAQTTAASSSLTARQTKREQNIVNRADQEITRRIGALNKLSERISNMVKLNNDEQQGLSATIQAQIQAMNSLQSQVQGDQDNLTNLKTDVQSITKSYRIYALVIPQGALIAAADRVMSVVTTMQTLAGKLQTRISAVPAGTANLTEMQNAMTDLNAKLADANTQAQAAVTEVSGLKPDNGVQTVMQSNLATMKDARSKIQAAQQDLVAARKDAGTVVKDLRTDNHANATSSAMNASSSQ